MQSRFGKIFDLAIGETLNGGDLTMNGNDLAAVYSQENQIYLAIVGGNVEASTPDSENKDFWGNYLLTPEQQFNSETQRTLKITPLSSAGRGIIEAAVKKDLEFLSPYSDVTVSVSIPKVDTVLIKVTILWNEGKKQLTVFTFKENPVTGDYSLEDYNNDYY